MSNNEYQKVCALKGCEKIITAKNGEGFVCIDCDRKFCSCECRTQAPKCEPQLAKERNHNHDHNHIHSFNDVLNNWNRDNFRYTSHTEEYNHEIEIHRQSLREFQEKKHHMELRLVEEENDWHGKCEYKNGWSKEKQIASIKKSIAGWEAKIQYEKNWLTKNGTEQDQQDLPKNKENKTENTPKLPNKDVNINSLIQYFRSQNIKRIELTSEGNFRIEYYYISPDKNNSTQSVIVFSEQEMNNNPELHELRGVKSYLQKTNKKELSQQELSAMISANSNSTLTEKPKNNMPLLIGGGIAVLVVGIVIGFLVRNRVKRSK